MTTIPEEPFVAAIAGFPELGLTLLPLPPFPELATVGEECP